MTEALIPEVILHDDIAQHADAYRHIFEAMDVRLIVADGHADLVAQVLERSPALVIVDAGVSNPDAMQAINSLKADKKSAHIPVLLVAPGLSDRRLRVHPDLYAAVEVLPRPFEIEQFFGIVRFFVEQYRYRRLIESLGKQQSQTLIENEKEGLLALDVEGKICFVNHAAERLLRARATTLVGKYVESILDDPSPMLVSQWVDHPVTRITRTEQVLQVDSTTLWRADGEPIHAKYAVIPLRDRDPVAHVFAFRELRESREDKGRQSFLNYSDTLTGLPLRPRTEELLERMLLKANQRGVHCAVLHVDMDHFRYINESLGHALGDQLLSQVARRLKPMIRKEDCLGRWEGDAFVIGLSTLDRPESAGMIARKVVDVLNAPYLINGHEIHASASVGIAVHPQCGDQVRDLLHNAEVAVRRAKQRGRNGHQFFSDDMDRELSDRLQLEADLHAALANDQFRLVRRAVHDSQSGQTVALEWSVVWDHPVRGTLAVDDVMGLVEEVGLAVSLGRWIWTAGLASLGDWLSATVADEHVRMIVPLPTALLGHPQALEWLLTPLQTAGLPASQFILPLQPSSAFERDLTTRDTLLALHRAGFQLALDDVGQGYWPLVMMEQLPLGYVRLSPAMNAARAVRGRLPGALLTLVRELGLTAWMAGVDDIQTLGWCRTHGCQWVSGLALETGTLPGTVGPRRDQLPRSD